MQMALIVCTIYVTTLFRKQHWKVVYLEKIVCWEDTSEEHEYVQFNSKHLKTQTFSKGSTLN